MFFLPDSARAHLADMGHRIDQEMAQSRMGPDLETEAARQAHYIKWAKIFGIPDPCGCYEGFIRIVAIYIKYVQRCVNYNNKQVFCSAMVQGYATFFPDLASVATRNLKP